MKYSNAQIAYHWATVLLLLVMASTGMAYFYEVGGNAPLTIHQIAGQLLICVLILRLTTRLISSQASHPQDHSNWERTLANITHLALYAALIVYVATGYVSASALSEPLLLAPVNKAFARSDLGESILIIHYNAKWILLGLVSLHILGALKHVLVDRDTTLSNMTFSKPTGDT